MWLPLCVQTILLSVTCLLNKALWNENEMQILVNLKGEKKKSVSEKVMTVKHSDSS